MVKKINKIGAPINDREEAEGGESGLNLSGGGGEVSRCVSFTVQTRSLSGREKEPRSLQTVNRL